MDEHLFVVAETVEKIKNGKSPCFVGVVAWRKNYAVIHGVCKNFAGKRVAFDAAGGRGSTIRDVKEVEEAEEVKERTGGLRTVSVHSTK
jgi:hypothetical protein